MPVVMIPTVQSANTAKAPSTAATTVIAISIVRTLNRQRMPRIEIVAIIAAPRIKDQYGARTKCKPFSTDQHRPKPSAVLYGKLGFVSGGLNRISHWAT